jgi:hypothetical protein
MPDNPSADVPTFQIQVSVTVPPLVIDMPNVPSSPIPPTINISGPDSKLAKIIYEKLVKSSDRRAFALVLASPLITEAQKKRLKQAFNNSFKNQVSEKMFENFERVLHQLDKLRKQLEAQAAGQPGDPGQVPVPEPPDDEEPSPPEQTEDPDDIPPPPEMDYTGTEKGFELKLKSPPDPDAVYDVRHPSIPAQAVPIYDDTLRAIIGYRAEVARGVYREYDLGGNVVGMSEKPLERPFLDLPDLVFIGDLGLKLLVAGALRLGLVEAVKTALKLDIKLISLQSISRMRAFFKGELKDLKFASTPIEHMNNPARYVPSYQLDMAIKYGKAAPDPEGRPGAFLYSITLRRAVKRSITEETLKKPSFKEYTLKVVIRAKDRTVLHFHYEKPVP